MSRITLLVLAVSFSFQALAQDLSRQGFAGRFNLVKNEQGKVHVIKLKRATTRFSIMPFLNQIKSDLLANQNKFLKMTDSAKEAEIDSMLLDLGFDPYAKNEEGAEEAQKIKESLLNVKNIDVEATFAQLDKKDFWKEFEAKLHEAFLFIDPTVVANLEDPRFFYKRQVTYKVVLWALDQAKKRFSSIPVLNIASHVIVRVHDMMLEQRYFHHNMLLHYFEKIPEAELGMSKEEVDRAVSSIYEYRIDATGFLESNRAARDWLNYGMDNFYKMVRAGDNRMRTFEGFQGSKKINCAFTEVSEAGARKIYHLHMNGHQFSKKPALAYDYSAPNRVKRNRSLLNLAGIGLGFIKMPGFLKSSIDNFIKSFYVQQVRMEGALVGYFESTGDQAMIKNVYAQRANFYILE
ncbi:MAG TPA: hypothetical protein VNJ01_01370 [Bacteriovoracaceae bacterium]|nr:hypothetical protein [Bacteriovoracaceae bacterium]